MPWVRFRQRIVLLGSGATLLALGGCLERIEHSINLSLSSGAIENALVLPYTGLMRIVEPLLRLLN